MKRLLCGLLAALMLCGCTALPAGTSVPPTTTVPATTAGPALKAGYYIYDGEYPNDTLLHFLISEDGTGYLSMLGIQAELTWTPEGGNSWTRRRSDVLHPHRRRYALGQRKIHLGG